MKQVFTLSAIAAALMVSTVSQAEEAEPMQLDAVQVSADKEQEGGDILQSEGRDSYAPEATNTATGLTLTPRETPQSVTVIGRQQMDDFALDSVADVMKRTPGVRVYTNDTERVRLSARGFDVENYLYDGMPSMRSSGLGSPINLTDTYIYDRIEVLRGASGLLNGIGNPSATVNLVRKKPTKEFQASAGLGFSSYDRTRVEGDVSGALYDDGAVRGRFVAAHEEGETYLDHYENEKSTFYGVVEADLSQNTVLSVGAEQMEYDPMGSTWGGVPLFFSNGNEADLPRSFNPATDWSSWAQDTSAVFTELNHHFANGWETRFAYTQREKNYDAYLASAGSGLPDEQTGAGMGFWVGRYVDEQTQDTIDLYAKGPFELGGRQHELIVGATNTKNEGEYYGFGQDGSFDTTLPSIYTWDGNRAQPAFNAVTAEEYSEIKQTGFYATTRLNPTDDLNVILGSRVFDWESSRNVVMSWQGAYQEDFDESGVVVPYMGVIYDIDDTHSIYGSFTSIFQPQTVRDVNNTILDPEEGNSYEFGLKSELNDWNIDTTLALFQIEQDNLAEATNQPIVGGPPNSVAYRAIDGAVTKGFEAQLAGKITENWRMTAGYTHRTTRDSNQQLINTVEPEDMVRLSSSYDFSDELKGLTVGGGISWQGQTYTDINRPPSNNPERFTQDEYFLLDAMASYQFTDNLTLGFNVSNLTDEKYFDNLGFYNGGYYGAAREYKLKATYDF